jgi:membrane protein implicated in regulation of membrane protease activity
MRWLKYFGAGFCVLLILGTLPSIYLIVVGLTAPDVQDSMYFVGKLVIKVVISIVLAAVAVKLIVSAKREPK